MFSKRIVFAMLGAALILCGVALEVRRG